MSLLFFKLSNGFPFPSVKFGSPYGLPELQGVHLYHLTTYWSHFLLYPSLLLLSPHFLSYCSLNTTISSPLLGLLLAVPSACNVIPPIFIRPTSLLLSGLCPSVILWKRISLSNLSTSLPMLILNYRKNRLLLLTSLLGWPGSSLCNIERWPSIPGMKHVLERITPKLQGSLPLSFFMRIV